MRYSSVWLFQVENILWLRQDMLLILSECLLFEIFQVMLRFGEAIKIFHAPLWIVQVTARSQTMSAIFFKILFGANIDTLLVSFVERCHGRMLKDDWAAGLHVWLMSTISELVILVDLDDWWLRVLLCKVQMPHVLQAWRLYGRYIFALIVYKRAVHAVASGISIILLISLSYVTVSMQLLYQLHRLVLVSTAH